MKYINDSTGFKKICNIFDFEANEFQSVNAELQQQQQYPFEFRIVMQAKSGVCFATETGTLHQVSQEAAEAASENPLFKWEFEEEVEEEEEEEEVE